LTPDRRDQSSSSGGNSVSHSHCRFEIRYLRPMSFPRAYYLASFWSALPCRRYRWCPLGQRADLARLSQSARACKSHYTNKNQFLHVMVSSVTKALIHTAIMRTLNSHHVSEFKSRRRRIKAKFRTVATKRQVPGHSNKDRPLVRAAFGIVCREAQVST